MPSELPIPYVKLLSNGREIKMPNQLFLTQKSQEILKKGTTGQGYIYFLDLDTGEIHLLAANNPSQTVDLSRLDPKTQMSTREAIIAKTIPIDRTGKPFKSDEYAITMREKTSSTGGGGGGDLHKHGASVLGLRDKNLLAGGFWIKWDQGCLSFEEFRTRSTENLQIVQFNPIYKFIFMCQLTQGHEVGHSQVYMREIPLLYLRPILEVFLQVSEDLHEESKDEAKVEALAKVRESLSLDLFEENENSVIPRSTLMHLRIENQWNPEHILSYIDQSRGQKGDFTLKEIDEFLRGYFDRNFTENLPLLKDVINAIDYFLDSPSSRLYASVFDSYFKDLEVLKTLLPSTRPLPDARLFHYAVKHNHLEAVQYFLDHNMLSLCSPKKLYKSYQLLILHGHNELANKLPNLQKIIHAEDDPVQQEVKELSIADTQKDEAEIVRLCGQLRWKKHPEVLIPYINKYNAQGDDYFREVKKKRLAFEEKPLKASQEIEKKYQMALTQYRLALLFDSKNTHALISQAEIYYELGQYAEALQYYEQAYFQNLDWFKSHPECKQIQIQALIGQAELEYGVGRYSEAIQYYEQVLAQDPDLFKHHPAWHQTYRNASAAVEIEKCRYNFLEMHQTLLRKPTGKTAALAIQSISELFKRLELYSAQDQITNPEVAQMLQNLLKKIYLAKLSHAQKANQTKDDIKLKHQEIVESIENHLAKHAQISWNTLEKIKNEISSTPWNLKEDEGKSIVIDKYYTSIRVPTAVAAIWEKMQQADFKQEDDVLQDMKEIATMALNQKKLTHYKNEVSNFYNKFMDQGEYAPKKRTDSYRPNPA